MAASGAVMLGYDGRGNLTSSGSDSYAYTSENRLANTSAGPGVFVYHPTGALFVMTWNGAETRFDYLGSQMIAEYNVNNVVQRRYVYGPGDDEPLVWYEGSGTGQRYWLHADERGSVVAVSDGSGNAVGLNAYDEYGIPAATNMGRFQYTGQAWIPEVGLYYYKARMHSPTLGRFMQTDPIGYGDGMNMYGYVGADPVNATDPSGMQLDPTVTPIQNCKDTCTGSRIPGNMVPGLALNGNMAGWISGGKNGGRGGGWIAGKPGSTVTSDGLSVITAGVAGYFLNVGYSGMNSGNYKPQNNTRKISDCMQKFLASKGLGGSNLGSVVFHNGDGGSLIAKAAFAHGNPAITIQNNVYVAPGHWNSFREGTSGFFEETVHSMQWDVSGVRNFVFSWALGSVAGAAFTCDPHNSPLEAQAMGMSVDLAKAYSEAGAQCGR